MPELPEVETVCRGLRAHIRDYTIQSTTVYNKNLRISVATDLPEQLAHKRICRITRRSKYIVIAFDSPGVLILHLGMSGTLRLCSLNEPRKKHDHIVFLLGKTTQTSNTAIELRYHDPRRFGSVCFYTTTDVAPFTVYGVEPLSAAFHVDYLLSCCMRTKRTIKTVLTDNRIVVGIGNIYVNEILFAARCRPTHPAHQLTRATCAAIVQATGSVLTAAIKAGGTTIKDFATHDGTNGYFALQLAVYGKQKQPCIECNTPIAREVQQGRSTFFCPSCQPAPPV